LTCTTTVGITLYLLLLTEFFLRFHLRKPLRSPAPSQHDTRPQHDNSFFEKPGTLTVAEVDLDDQVLMTQRTKLMVVGLVVTTLLILIRYVKMPACTVDPGRELVLRLTLRP